MCMVAASTSYEARAGPAPAVTATRYRPCRTTHTATHGANPTVPDGGPPGRCRRIGSRRPDGRSTAFALRRVELLAFGGAGPSHALGARGDRPGHPGEVPGADLAPVA